MNRVPRLRDVKLQTETVGCGLCGSCEGARLYTERYLLGLSAVELGINRCRKCSLVYVSPRLTPVSTQLVYELDAGQTISREYCWDGDLSERRFAPLLQRLAQLARPGALLDVGCGGGQFLRVAQRTGRWRVTGVEPMSDAASQAQLYSGGDVRCATLDAAGFSDGSFEVITMLGVLEHLHDPVATLRLARTLLKTGGVLAAYVPNFHYLALKDAGPICYARTRRWTQLHPQEHLFHYTPATLREILHAAGFDVLRIEVGRPFTSPNPLTRWAKEAGYWAACALQATTGIHLGGLEVIARVSREVASISKTTTTIKAA
jgi:SAM-dependent methyltransferase